MNNLSNSLENSHAAMYADDTNITVRSSSLTHLEEALNIVNWKIFTNPPILTLDVEKTDYIIIGTRQRLKNLSQDINVSINGKVLKEVETKKSLGVLTDEHLYWDKQLTTFERHWHVASCKASCDN